MQFGNICTFFPLPHFRNIQKLGSNGLLTGWVPNLSKHGECHLHTSGGMMHYSGGRQIM